MDVFKLAAQKYRGTSRRAVKSETAGLQMKPLLLKM
jgi:hypothetical protein